MFNYPKQAWDAAMLASYALEGKKDNVSINFAVAAKLLDDEQLYLSKRQEIKDHGVDIAPLNNYHMLCYGNWNNEGEGVYYKVWTNCTI